MKELIDYFNSSGEHIGEIDKAIAHQEGLWHKAIHVWIINDNNQILIQKRSADKEIFPNVWDISVGGHVSAGEDTLSGAVRELEEELGIKVKPEHLVYLFTNKEILPYKDIISNEFVDVYLLKRDIKIEDINLQEEEVAGVKYVDIDDFFRLTETEEFLPHIVEYEKLKGILK